MVRAVVSGWETLESIERALSEVSEDADRLKRELDEANKEKAALMAERLEAFQDLAKFRAQLSLVDGVIDEADQLSAQVRSILQARQKTLSALEQLQSDASKERADLREQQKTRQEEIERLESQLDTHGEKAKKLLRAEPAYKAHADCNGELESMVANASAKAEKSRAEEKAKGTPYRSDALFMYLWERGYGTSGYDKTGIIRVLDRWVAKLIGYQDARANFAVLIQIPERLAAHAERLRALLQAEQDALGKLEAEKIRELAGTDLLGKLQVAHARQTELIAKLERLNADLTETGNQLKTYAEGEDQSFRDAVEKTTRFLGGQSLTALRHEARATADVDDDEIVALIQKLTEERDALEELAENKREDLDAAFRRKEELLRIASEFRRSRYDSPSSVFEPEDEGGMTGKMLLQMLLEGAITAVDYWARTQSRQRWRSRTGDSYRRSESTTFGGRSRSRPSSGGPDFRTGGGF